LRPTIRTKLFANLALSVALLIGLGVFAISEMSTLNHQTRKVATTSLPASEILGSLSTGVTDYARGIAEYQAVSAETRFGSPQQAAALKPVLAQLTKDQAAVAKAFAQFKKLDANAREDAAWTRVHKAWTDYLTGIAVVTKLQAQHATEAQINAAAMKPIALLNAIPAQIDAWRAISSGAASATVAKAGSTYSHALWIVIALLAFATVAAAAIGLLLARSVSSRLRALAGAAERIATGDLRHELHDDSADEIGSTSRAFAGMVAYFERIADAARGIAAGDLTVEVTPQSEHDVLAHAFSEMTVNLRTMINRLAEAAGSIGASSEEMASSSLEAGRTVSEIARAISDVAAGAERQVRVVEQAKQSTSETGSAVQQTKSVADDGVRAAERVGHAMDALRESTSGVTTAIRGLAAKSEEIGGIVATITGIAGQTNLLALNAAIEAARAGEQGRGFAVVAEEVRKLAEESQQAAESISALVEEIQSETERTVHAVEDGARATSESAATVEEAREAFQQIGVSVEEMTVRIAQIVEATNEVAAVAEQSSAATEQVSASTDETSSSAARISDSAQGLAATAQELQALVGQFTLA
jgi:methyl-accepting chemotaxis protein